MLRSICKKTDLGAQYACKHVIIRANMLMLENKLSRSRSAVERQDGEVQRWKSCCLQIDGKGLWELDANAWERELILFPWCLMFSSKTASN
jgi:hypothetical protein